MSTAKLNTDLFPRPFSTHRPRVRNYEPLIKGEVNRVSRSRRNSWKCTIFVDENPMAHAFFDTKTRAESWCAGMMETYTLIHYFNV